MLTKERYVMRYSFAVFMLAIACLGWLSSSPASATDLYWAQYDYEGSDRFSLQRTRVNGSRIKSGTEVIHSMGDQPAYAGLVVSDGKVYWQTYFGNSMEANLDGTGLGTAQGYTTRIAFQLQGADLDSAGVYSFWPYANPGVIRIGDFEGENQTDLIYTRFFDPNLAIALDEVHGKIYWAGAWSGGDTGIIQRANLDGTQVETLVSGGLFMDDYPVDLVLDVPRNKMYWTNMANHKIQRANLDGSQVEDVVTGVSPFSIALDIRGGGGGRNRN